MFQELVDGVRLLVGAHGGHGCTVRTAIRALREVLLPQCRMQPNEALVTTTLEMVRADAHITCFQFLAAADSNDQRGIADGSPGSVGPAPANWPERAWSDPLMQQALFLQPSRALQSYVLGIDAGYFMGPASWAMVDLLGQTMVRGATREMLREAAIEADNVGAFYLSMKRMVAWELVTSAAVIVGNGGQRACAFQQRFFLRIANPAAHTSTSSTFLGVWLERERSCTRLCDDAVSGVGGDDPDDDDDEEEDDEHDAANVVDDEDVPLGILQPLRSVRNQQRLSMPSEHHPGQVALSTPIAVEDKVVERLIRSHGGTMTLRLLTRQLMRYYGVVPDGSQRFSVSSTAVTLACLQRLSAIRVCTKIARNGHKQATVTLTTVAPDQCNVKTEDAATLHEARSSGMAMAASDANPSPGFSFFPLRPLEPQIVEAAHTAPVVVEDTRPSFCQRSMKQLVSRVKALAAAPSHVAAVDVSTQRSATCKSFTIVVKPSQQQQSGEHRGVGVGGVSEWARDVVLGLLRDSEHGAVVLDAVPLDIRTLKRLIPVLRSDGAIVTSGMQLTLRGKRYGLILDPARASTITDAQKRNVIEAYVAATATALHNHNNLRVKTERTDDISDLVTVKSEDGEDQKLKRRRVDAAAPRDTSRSVRQGMIDKARATVVSVGNGLATSHTARCWRLHLELWVVVLRLRAAKKVYWSSDLSCTVGQLLEEMSLSTFCVVVGFNADRIGAYVYNRAQVPWGTPVRQLQPKLRAACAAHGAGYLMAALQSLGDCGAVLIPDVTAAALSTAVADPRRVDRALKIVLATELRTADGRSWPMLGVHPTEVLTNVSLFWGTHAVASSFTPMPKINAKRLVPLCEVLATSPALSLTEIAVLSDYFRASLPSMAQLAMRARGDMTQISPAGLPASITTTTVDGTLRKVMRNHNAHPAVAALLAAGESNAAQHGGEDEGLTTVGEGEEDGAIPVDAERKLISIRPQLENQHVLNALRLAVLDDHFFGVLKRIRHILKKNSLYMGVLECLMPMLQRLGEYVDAHAIPPNTFRDMREEVLESLVAPCGPANTPSSKDMHRLRFESITASYTPTADSSSVVAVRVVHENEGLADAIRCILFSRWDAIDSASRDGLLSPFPPDRVPVVCHALRRAFAYTFALPKDMGGEDGRRFLQVRLQTLITSGRCLYGHIPVRFSAQALSESVVLRQAHAIAMPCAAVEESVVAGGRRCDAVASSSGTELLRQEIVDMQALGGNSGDHTLDAMHVPRLQYPSEWTNSAKNNASANEATAPSSGSAEYTPNELRYREPAAWSWRHPPRNELLSEDAVLRYTPENLRDVRVPPALHGTALCHANGQLNALVASVECARVRAFLLGAPGSTRQALCTAMTNDGVLSVRVAEFIIQLLERSGHIGVQRRSKAVAHRRMFPLKRSREDDASNPQTDGSGEDALWWQANRRPESVFELPLNLFRSTVAGPSGGGASCKPAPVVSVSAL